MPYAIRSASTPHHPKGETVTGAIWRMYNLLVAALDGHVHGGVTAGGAASSGWVAPGTTRRLATVDNRDPSGAAVAAAGSGTVATYRPRFREGRLMSELTIAFNQLLGTLTGHTHVATAGGANSGAWAAPATIRKVADLSGMDPSGAVVTPSANGAAVLRLAGSDTPGTHEGELVLAWNALVQAIDGHVHGGVTAGGANTGVNSPAFTSANAAKVAGLYGRDVDGAIVA